jgi:hypothetical protein
MGASQVQEDADVIKGSKATLVTTQVQLKE